MLIQRLGYLVSRFPRLATTATTLRTIQQRSLAFSTANTTRPFKILGVQQIAIGSEDRTGLAKLWQDIFGCQVHNSITIPSENVEEDILQVGLKHFPVEIDLMTPIDPEKSPKVCTCIHVIHMYSFVHL
jgi:Glyoxalase/Bleomycin resistance protein/Dioxygenase superfamily